MSKIRFTKMHGCGNDYIYVDAMRYPVQDPSSAAVALSDRHKGIGSDGLVLIDKSPVPEADFSMRIFNADGSEAMMCGNASRCIGKYVYEKTRPWPLPVTEGNGYKETQIRLLTKSGVKILHLHILNEIVESVTVDMGAPVLEDERLFNPRLAGCLSTPLHNRKRLRVGELSSGMGQGGVSALFVSMGNPHYVVFTDNIDQVGETGHLLEHHPAFPERCNIEFAAPLLSPLGGRTDRPTPSGPSNDGPNLSSPQRGTGGGLFRVRVWERGSGITQACGTGACATAVAAFLTGRSSRHSTIVMDGGTLNIEWRESNNHVYMTGPASFVFDGEIGIE